MTDTQYGPPLTGEQMRLLQAAGLPDDVMVKPPYGAAEESINFCYISDDYRLPTDHIAYTLLEKGWLDIPNVRLWFGGDKAPSDWKGGPLLRENGEIAGAFTWSASDPFGYTVIAYIAKAESAYPPDGGLKDQVREPSECQSAFQTIADAVGSFLHRSGWEGNQDVELALDLFVKDMAEKGSVTIAKMTEAEWVQKYDLDDEDDVKAMKVIQDLGLIKPEPTLEERFWQGKERNSLSQDEAVKALVREALNFERSD